MDFAFGEREETLRKEIREFVRENIPAGNIGHMFEEESIDEEWEFAMSISKKLSEKGWLTMSWPKEHGGMGASDWEKIVFMEEAAYWGIPGMGMGVGGTAWVGPSLMIFGTEEQQKKHLPLIASGDPDGVWCTGYSEPDSGSDLASLQTSAVRDGDDYVINGQKVWNSAGHRARWCWLACRTKTDVKKKTDGISIIMVDMKSEGVEVRPLINLVGYHYFNEIFFKDVRVPVSNLVGRENNGWAQLMRALAFERSYAVIIAGISRRVFDELVHYAVENGKMNVPYIRQNLADVAIAIEELRLLAYEAAWKIAQGRTVIYEPSRDKAKGDMLFEKLSSIGTEIIGAYSQICPLHKNSKWTKLKGALEHIYWATPGGSLAAGTTDTQRNIVGQFGLNLPKAY
jgi:alkylation response protein AidB-like acyl-CoA dehydrogenase